MLGLRLSVQALETLLAEDAHELAAFDALPRPSLDDTTDAADAAATILVVQTDGKGVPMVLPLPTERPVRPSYGLPANWLKEAIVTACYTVTPYPRTPDQIVTVQLGLSDTDRPADLKLSVARSASRPRPVDKQVRATLDGKTVAVARLADAVRRRLDATIQYRVALTDGVEALQTPLLATLPGHILILDIIHAAEYLWDAVNALLGEPSPTPGLDARPAHRIAAGTDRSNHRHARSDGRRPKPLASAPGCLATHDPLLPAHPALDALRSVSGARPADRNGRRRGFLRPSRQGPVSAGWHALDD